jgi:outer membrane lipoprotein carrier protein
MFAMLKNALGDALGDALSAGLVGSAVSKPRRRWLLGAACGWVGLCAVTPAQAADAVALLRSFVQEVKAGRAEFTQTVTSPDAKKQKTSTGRFEFQRPNHFRFTYLKPYAQTIVSDGAKVWFFDPDLNQVTVRKLGDALGATPASLLASSSMDKDFELKPEAERDGLSWVLATPRQRDGTVQWLKVGFQGKTLAAVEIADSFGQRSVLRMQDFSALPSLPAETFRFVVPAGADVAEQ